MKINRIELYNIGSYEGYNEFDIAAQKLPGNIIVVGGKNGAGKTTLFTAIKLCLYGFKEAGYQAMNAHYKRSIKKLVNDKAKAENNANAYTLLDLDILNGQEWDNYIIKREWFLEGNDFESFSVKKNGRLLLVEELVDFENFLMNLLPPELFDLYFFDGEQIADFFLEDTNNERIKNAFLTICGYDTFDIIYKNFQRVSKQQGNEDDPTMLYFETEDNLYHAEKRLKKCEQEIQITSDEIEAEDAKINLLDESFRAAGGISIEEWNKKLLELKNEERIREEKNSWVKNAVNDMIPYIILKRELQSLLERMESEKEAEHLSVLKESLWSLIPEILDSVSKNHPEVNSQIKAAVLDELRTRTNSNTEEAILNLSKNEYKRLVNSIMSLIEIDKEEIINARMEIKNSRNRSQLIRDELEKSTKDGQETYLEEKTQCVNNKLKLINKRELLLEQLQECKEELEKANSAYAKASKDLEKHFKSQSVTALTAKAVLFLESLQKKLYDSEIQKVKTLFMDKMSQLKRKEQFIERIEIDDDFKIHVYKSVSLEIVGIQNKIRTNGEEAYMAEYGKIHCDDLLNKTSCSSLVEFLYFNKPNVETVDVLMEFDRTTMSKGEKQVFIMALYWSIMQLCNKDIPFIIDTPFARIDTEHREHITEHFFKELKGQIFIFSTDEEITERHINVIGEDLGGKFLIENVNNTKTSIIAGKYFGE